jgi:hypothetical protein
MKIKITERQLKTIIEESVRRVLLEKETEKTDIISQLKQPGINQAEVARHLISTVWSGMDEDTARSLLSKKVRGEISITDSERNAILNSLRNTIKVS